MTFFYDLNKRLAQLASKQDAKQISEDAKAAEPKSKLAESMDVAEASYSAKAGRAGKDLGKPGKNFAKIAKSAGQEYGSKAAGERVAGAVLNKLRSKTEEGVDKEAFAKLAPPTDKITFADKIAGAKKEVDEMLGDVAADAMRKAVRGKQQVADEGNAFTGKLKSTPKGGKFKLGNKEFTDTSEVDEGFGEMDAWLKSREKEKGTGRFDKRKVSTGTVYTRKPETFDDPETDPEATGGAPKRRGRPKGKDKGPERVTAKSYKYKAGRPTKTAEDLDTDGVMMTRPSNMSSEGIDPNERGEYDQEGESAKHDIKTIVRHAQALHKILGDDDNLPEWVQSKLAKIEGMMIAVDEYMQNQDGQEELDEKAVSKKQQKFMGMVHAAQKGEKPASKEVAKVSKEMPKKAAKDFAATKHKGLPEKVKAKKESKEEVDETTVAGSVATSATADKKSSGGMQFGKGVYEGFNNTVESMITEGMNVSVNMSTGEDGQPSKSITISADGAEADQLAELLKMAGLHDQSDESCNTCGTSPCGCSEVVDENSPDWPTDKETLEAEPNLRTYSGGLNGPKSTGQSTVPVLASQARRQGMEESVELERNLFKTWQDYKG